ncbi:MAG: DNA polymerase subunit beta, partial [Anaerolineales bacterium]|nr:DNA polymerase subunit beta [Anaerolineales bacterium]
MPRKPLKRFEYREVTYAEHRWQLLSKLRAQAAEIMECLQRHRIASIVHGSIARGDIDFESDIDVFVPNPPSSFLIENALE